MEEPRSIKTHLPWHLLPDQLKNSLDTKIVYTLRNPKDQVISYYHYCLLCNQIDATLEEFIDAFLDGHIVYGSSAKHMLEFYKRRDQPNILMVKYEDMKRDLPSVIRRCADHLEITRKLTNEDIDNLCDYVKFERMEKNSSVNLEAFLFADPTAKEKIDLEVYSKMKFIRKGQVGGWQNYLSPALNDRLDKWIAENFDGTGLTFEYV
jgi:estrone sulfotransferase